MTDIERRGILETVEIRDDSDGPKLTGYAALYDSESVTLPGGFTEVLQRGCFDDVLKDPNTDCIACFNHDPSLIMGRQSAGTLKLSTDDRGLRYTVYPVPESRSDVLEAIRLKNVVGSSFAFTVNPDDETYERSDDGARRIVKRCSGLYDVCPVVSPAYPETSAAVRQRALEAMNASKDDSCVCGSGKPYGKCCGRYGFVPGADEQPADQRKSPLFARAGHVAQWLRRV